MDYPGLIEDDVINVRALNRAWLRIAGAGSDPFAVLDDERRRRIANAPFLLFTLRENEARLWSALLNDRPQRELFGGCPSIEQRELQVACLAWLWELVRRNPYVARVVAGAPLPWCERIAAYPLVQLLQNAADADLVRPRFRDDSPVHRRLLLRGGSALRAARSAAQLAAMQAMLTASEIAQYGRMSTAACRLRAPTRQVAE